MTAPTPGQAAYEAYLAHLQGADPGYGQWVKPFADIDKHDRDAWEAAEQAAQKPLREIITEILAEFGRHECDDPECESYVRIPTARLTGWRERAGLEA